MTYVLNEGIPELLKEKLFPPKYSVKGHDYSLIILAPQFTGWPVVQQVESFIQFAIKEYRVDQSRIYLTGLSMGGILVCDVAGQYTNQVAAIVPISGVSLSDPANEAKNIAKGNLPVWVFQNDKDEVFHSYCLQT